MDVEANNSLRSQIALFLEKHCPAFRYKGRANHVGYWETSSDNDQLIELTKPNGDAGRAAFRLIVHFPNEYGIPFMLICSPRHIGNGKRCSMDIFQTCVT